MTFYLLDDAELIRSFVSDDLVPPESDVLFLLYAVLMRAKGIDVTASDVHDAWAAWAFGTGDFENASLIPYANLAKEKQMQDTPFVNAIRRAVGYRQLEASGP
ncbi:hypothetical protein ABGB07_45110 [Micromonosporaceae bacterium B7E4]